MIKLSCIVLSLLSAARVLADVELRSHRGNLSGHPEHTVESYVSTLKAGATLIELDVHLSSDGVPVVIHDATLDRTTNGTGNVNAFTLAQLKTYDAGVDFGGGYAGRRIPTLEEALNVIRPYRSYVLIETKGTGFMPQVSLAINRAGFPVERLSFLAGLFTDTAATFRTYFPSSLAWTIQGGTPTSIGQSGMATFRTSGGYAGVSFWPIAFVEGDYAIAQAAGVLIGEYVAGGTGIYAKALLGCNLFLTDNPAASQSEWGTSLWSAFVAQYSLGAGTTTQDADSDGFTNLEELVYGTNPNVDDTPSAPFGVEIRYAGTGANRLADVTCRTPKPILEGYWFKIQTSEDGTSWSDASTSLVTESSSLWPGDRSWRIRVNLSGSTAIVRAVPILYSTAARP